MAKKTAKAAGPALKTADLVALTIRVDPMVARRIKAFLQVTDRTYRDVAEAAFVKYLDSVKLDPAKQRAVAALLAAGD